MAKDVKHLSIGILDSTKVGSLARVKDEKPPSWDDYYDTASMIAAEEKRLGKRSLSYHDLFQQQKENVELLLASKVDHRYSSSSQPVGVDSRPLKTAAWTGSSTVKGEVLYKLFMAIICQHYAILPNDIWPAVIDLLLYARMRSVLPPTMAILSDHCSGIFPHIKSEVALPVTRFAAKCFRFSVPFSTEQRLITSTSLVAMKSAIQRPSVSNLSLWGAFSSILWSNIDENPTEINPSEKKASRMPNIVVTLQQLSKYIQKKSMIPYTGNSSVYEVLDANVPVTIPSNASDEMLRVVMFSSKIDQVVFMTAKDSHETTVLSIFDAIMGKLCDCISSIVSLASCVDSDDDLSAVIELNAATLLEWAVNIVMSNAEMALWLVSKLYKSSCSLSVNALLINRSL